MAWETAQTSVQIVKDGLTVVALLAGGGWAWYKWREANELCQQVIMDLTTEEYPVHDQSSVLVIGITLKNVGYRSLIPGSKGLQVSVRRCSGPNKDRCLERSEGEALLTEVDILSIYKEDGAKSYTDAYRLDRGSTYHETYGLIIDRGYVYIVEAGLWLAEDDALFEYHYHVSTDPSRSVAHLPTSPPEKESPSVPPAPQELHG